MQLIDGSLGGAVGDRCNELPKYLPVQTSRRFSIYETHYLPGQSSRNFQKRYLIQGSEFTVKMCTDSTEYGAGPKQLLTPDP